MQQTDETYGDEYMFMWYLNERERRNTEYRETHVPNNTPTDENTCDDEPQTNGSKKVNEFILLKPHN